MSNLNKEQARAVNKVNGPCLCLAGPGSGKTFTIVERIRHMIEDEGISPSEILVITFSNKSAEEMKHRFYRMAGNVNYPVYFGTFHAIFYSMVKRYYHLSNENILQEKDKLRILNNILLKNGISDLDNYHKRELIQNFALYKMALYSMQDNEELLFIENKGQFLSLYKQYTDFCKKEKKLDFDDMLYICSDLLHRNKELLDYYKSIYKYILVDEFQDVNDVQYDALMLLAGDNRNVFVVGDDDQAIYGFRGSKPEYMKKFIDDNIDCEVINLSKNYRCSSEIIAKSRQLIINNKNRIDKVQIAGKKDKDEGNVIIKSLQNECQEAEYVLCKLKEIDKISDSIAIIYRTVRCVGTLEEQLSINGYKINKKDIGCSFYDEKWVVDIINYIKLSCMFERYRQKNQLDNYSILKVISKEDGELLFSIINKPDRNITRDMFDMKYQTDEIDKFIKDLGIIYKLDPFGAVNYIFKAVGYEQLYLSRGIREGIGIELLKDKIAELCDRARNYKSNVEWLVAIDLLLSREVKIVGERKNKYTVDEKGNSDNQKDDSQKTIINMLTAHSSKGLEFDTVFVVGLTEGIFPHRKAVSPEQIEEERRLLYVAMTRAKKNLYVLGRGEEKNGKRISRFISEIEGNKN